MNLTRVRATIVAGMLVSSMLLPGITVLAADGDGATDGEARINKVVTVANDAVTSIPAAHKDVTFSVNQIDNQDGIVAPNHSSVIQQGEQGYYTGKTVTIDVSDLTDPDALSKAILTGAGISLSDVGEYTFEVKETTTLTKNADGSQASFGWTKVDETTYYLRVLIKQDGTNYYFLTTTYGDTTVGNKKSVAEFTNIYNKKSTTDGSPDGEANKLTVTKEVVNPGYVSGSNLYDIDVTVQLPTTQKNANDQYFIADGDYTVTFVQGCILGNACNADVDDRVDTNLSSGTVSYTGHLHDGDSIVISDLAEGATYSVVETGTDKFQNLDTTKYKVDGATTGAETCTNQTFDNNDSTVIVENTFKDVTATGVVTSVAPYITLVAVAAAGVAGYVVLKGRIAR